MHPRAGRSWPRSGGAVAGGRGLAAAIALTLCACGPAEDVSVGEESGALNVARCFGSGTRCSTGLDTEEVAPSAFVTCTPWSSRALDVLLSRDLNADACAELECGLSLERLAIAPDGSAWVLGRLLRGSSADTTLVVAHWSVDGERLGYAEVASDRNANIDLLGEIAVDDRGHAYVVWYSSYAPDADADLQEAVRLHEYDGSAQLVGAPLAFRGAGFSRVQAGGDGVAMAGNAEHDIERGFVARLDRAGSLRFNQTNVPTVGAARGGISGLTLAADGKTTLLADRERWHDGSVTLGLTRFGADGNPIWDRALTSGYEPGYASALGSDSAGNVTTWALLSRSLHQATSSTALAQIETFDAAGQQRWAMRVETRAWNPTAFAIEPASGRLYVSGDGILEIASDGSSCRMLEPSGPPPRAIAIGKRGDLYTISGGTLTRYGGVNAE